MLAYDPIYPMVCPHHAHPIQAGVADYVVTLVVRDPAEMLPGDPAPALVGVFWTWA